MQPYVSGGACGGGGFPLCFFSVSRGRFRCGWCAMWDSPRVRRLLFAALLACHLFSSVQPACLRETCHLPLGKWPALFFSCDVGGVIGHFKMIDCKKTRGTCGRST